MNESTKNPCAQDQSNELTENPIASGQLSVTFTGVGLPYLRPYHEAYSHVGVYGQSLFNGELVTILSERTYFDFLATKRQFDDFKNVVSKNSKHRAQIDELELHIHKLEHQIHQLILDNENLKQNNGQLRTDNEHLQREIEEWIANVNKMTKDNKALKIELDELKTEMDNVKREMGEVKRSAELQRLKFKSAEIVYEIQRLLIRSIWNEDDLNDDEADQYVHDLNKLVLFSRNKNSSEYLAMKALALPVDNQALGRAFKSFKFERTRNAHPEQTANQSWDDLRAELIKYCELDAELRVANQEARTVVQQDKLMYITQADTLIKVGKQLIPSERGGLLFNKQLSI